MIAFKDKCDFSLSLLSGYSKLWSSALFIRCEGVNRPVQRFERACDQGSADSLKDYFRSLRNGPEYEKKTERYYRGFRKMAACFS